MKKTELLLDTLKRALDALRISQELNCSVRRRAAFDRIVKAWELYDYSQKFK